MQKQYRWYILRPQTLRKMRTLAGYDKDHDLWDVEHDMRKAMSAAAQKADLGPTGTQYLPLYIPGRRLVFAILVPSDLDNYDYMIPTVLEEEPTDPAAHAAGRKTKRTNRSEDLPKQIQVHWTSPDGVGCSTECTEDTAESVVRNLLTAGVRRNTVRVFKELQMEVDLEVTLQGVTS